MQSAQQRIASFVRQRRKENRLNQTTLALLAGVGRRFVSELESGHKDELRLDKVEAVLRVFGKTLDLADLEEEEHD